MAALWWSVGKATSEGCHSCLVHCGDGNAHYDLKSTKVLNTFFLLLFGIWGLTSDGCGAVGRKSSVVVSLGQSVSRDVFEAGTAMETTSAVDDTG